VTREPGLGLAEDLGEVGDAPFAGGAERDEPQPCRLGDGAQGGEYLIHGFLMT